MDSATGTRPTIRRRALATLLFALFALQVFSGCMDVPRCETRLADGGSTGFTPNCGFVGDAGDDAGTQADSGVCDGGSDGGC